MAKGSKLHHPSTREIPIINAIVNAVARILELGASLDVGAWNLELSGEIFAVCAAQGDNTQLRISRLREMMFKRTKPPTLCEELLAP